MSVALRGHQSRAGGLGDVGRLELVKWIAFVAMVADHVDLIAYGRTVPFLHELGAFAFPAFCLAFGLGLARAGDLGAIAARLLWPALAAQLAWMRVDASHPANVLAVFMCCALVLSYEVPPVMRAAGVLFLAGWSWALGEGGPWGVLMVAGAFAAGRSGRWWPLLAGGAGWVALVPSAGAVAALLAVACWPARWPRLARWRGALAWAYPAHLVALALL